VLSATIKAPTFPPGKRLAILSRKLLNLSPLPPLKKFLLDPKLLKNLVYFSAPLLNIYGISL